MKKSSTVIIADDHAIVRQALCDVFAQIDGADVVGEAEDGVAALTLAKSVKPDLMTLDSGMPLARGYEVFVEVKRWAPETRIAVVTGFTSVRQLADWIAAGVDGLFLKTCSPEEMRRGFSLILQGGSYIAEPVVKLLEDAPPSAELTLRERQILHLIAEGQTNSEIAAKLSISAKTVDNHRTRMMAKLDVHSVAQLLAYALKEGLLDQNVQL